MKNIGIVAEYNPFHNGHAYHIEQARKIAGGGSVIAVMSASFVQRGEPAAFDKFTRTAMALQGGADMVLELPDILSLSCAERFALGGVRILSASGIADRLCFGSEGGDIDALRRAADSKLSGDELSSALSSGLSYPAAAARQLRAHGIGVGSNNPNDVLGIEYIRALNRIAPAIRPFARHRRASAADTTKTLFPKTMPRLLPFAARSCTRPIPKIYAAGTYSPQFPAAFLRSFFLKYKSSFPNNVRPPLFRGFRKPSFIGCAA